MPNELTARYIKRENEYFEIDKQGFETYRLNRTRLTDLSYQVVDAFLKDDVQPKILEVGCGDGSNLLSMLRQHKNLYPENLIGTCLQYLPTHPAVLNTSEINIYSEILAEQLPSNWTRQFDVVMASASLRWSIVDKSAAELLRVTKKRGYIMGYDDSETVDKLRKCLFSLGSIKEFEANPLTCESMDGFHFQVI